MRRGLAALLVCVFAGLVLASSAVPAGAEPTEDDVVDSMEVGYTVTPEGVLQVRETIVYRFGTSSGRHGIFRDLVTREIYADDQSKDQRYDISDIRVSSPSGDSAEVTEEKFKANGDRKQTLRLQIGSADRVVVSPTATYVIEYEVRGAMRHFDDHSELYWDVTGDDWDATLRNVTARVEVPGGVRRDEVFRGPGEVQAGV